MNKRLIEGDYVHNAGIVLDFIFALQGEGKSTEQIDREMRKEFGISWAEFNPLFWMRYFCKGDEEE